MTTTKGNALAMASFGKPITRAITRAIADRLLTGLIDRAATWNTDQGRLISIEQLVVFGSYLDPTADRLGDLDIAATLTHWPQHADPKDWNRRCEDHLHASAPQLLILGRPVVLARRRSTDDAAQPIRRHQHHHRRRPQPHHQMCHGLHPGYLASVRLHPK